MKEVRNQTAQVESSRIFTDDSEDVQLPIQSFQQMTGVPKSMISQEIEGIYGSALLQELDKIIKLYNVYEKGARFTTEGGRDYVPAQLRYKQAKALVDKQARFMFSKPPEIIIDIPTPEDFTDAKIKEHDVMKTKIQDFVDTILKGNMFSKKLLQAGKDCFIGKRVALIANFNDKSGITLRFVSSLEFVYDTDTDDADKLTKLVTFYTQKNATQRKEQRIYKKKYELIDAPVTKQNPFGTICHITESIYDGLGNIIETTMDEDTLFPYIPATIIINDGLTGDLSGESEIEGLRAMEAWYSRLSNADMDAMRKGMNPIRYTLDMHEKSTANLSISAGAFWDLTSSDPEFPGKVGVLETDLGYSGSLASTLDRIKSTMYESIDVPDTSSAAMKGVVSSGKTLQAIYWGLVTRCDEKWLVWKPAIEFIVKCLIDGARLYPDIAKKYVPDGLPEISCNVNVDHNYPIPKDEAEEKATDLAQVSAQTMSRKTFMIKWQGMTPRDADKELKQLLEEKALLEDSAYSPVGKEETIPQDGSEDTVDSTGLQE